ncbi:MAG: hypothetical protein EOO28_09330 [Comamonadaceae bacterium]|nr:MAG: hypothetical protein EOO28_09330 [Comamonadaceae bacterium]
MKIAAQVVVIALAAMLASFGAQSAPAEKLLIGAGPLPSDARAKAAILKNLQSRSDDLDRKKPFRVLSGPTLATGNTFGGSIEQAWLMCIVLNAEKISPGPRQLEGRPVYLRSRGRDVVVVPADNWQDSSPKC